ncbi:uncharacterized protein [Asterias amurensis]|uniref:uncharacterized protein n=1 Tax=Asterias amurensis TaxID=7602 RepID=UPI003AB59D51
MTLPISVDRSVLVGRLAGDDPTKRSLARATVSKPPPSPKTPTEENQAPLSPTVISRSPTPISPLHAPPRSPSIRLGGKPCTMLAIMRGKPANTDDSPPGTSSESLPRAQLPRQTKMAAMTPCIRRYQQDGPGLPGWRRRCARRRTWAASSSMWRTSHACISN